MFGFLADVAKLAVGVPTGKEAEVVEEVVDKVEGVCEKLDAAFTNWIFGDD